MDALSGYLAKFYALTPPTREVRQAVQLTVAHEFGVTLDAEQIAVQQHTVTIHGNPALKQEVFMRQDTILAAVNERLAQTGQRIERIT